MTAMAPGNNQFFMTKALHFWWALTEQTGRHQRDRKPAAM
jgi:hypothetical protein